MFNQLLLALFQLVQTILLCDQGVVQSGNGFILKFQSAFQFADAL